MFAVRGASRNGRADRFRFRVLEARDARNHAPGGPHTEARGAGIVVAPV